MIKKNRLFLTLMGTGVSIFLAGSIFYFSSFFVDSSASAPKEISSTGDLPPEDEDFPPDVLVLSPEQVQNAGLQVRMLSSGSIEKTIAIPGRVIPNPAFYAHLVTKTGGVVKEARKNFGDQVQAGEVIAVLESHEMAEAKAQFLASKHRLDLALTLYRQEKKLYDKGITPGEDFYKAETALTEAKILHELAKQRLYSLGSSDQEVQALEQGMASNFSLLEIRSPLSGTVLQRHLTVGEIVPEGEEIYVIANLKEVWVEFSLYPKDIEGIREGELVEIVRNGKKAPSAEIFLVSPVMDVETGRIKVLATLNNSSGDWRPGTYVEGKVVIEKFDAALVVPTESIVKIDNVDSLFIATTEGFEKRDISVGRSDNEYTEILAGVLPGERYVAKNAFILKFELSKGEASHDD